MGLAASTTFDQHAYDLAYPDGAENHYWTIARNHVVLKTIRRYELQGIRWLDIGCGRGVVLRHLLANRIDCRGVELAEARPLDDVTEVIVVGQDAMSMPAEFRRSFQGVLLLDVIEHLPDPVGFLTSIGTHYPSLQYVLLTVPARTEIWSNYDEFYGHYRRYDLALLDETVRSADLTLRELRYFFHTLYPPAWLLARLRKSRSVKISAPTARQKPIHRLLAAYLIAETALLPRRWLGTSLLCLACR